MNFDKHYDRLNTNSYKFDFWKENDMPEGLQSMWVADMDFPTVPKVVEEVEKIAKKGIFGYTRTPQSYYDALIEWFFKRHNYKIERDWVIETPGIVFAFNQAIRAYTNLGDAVIIQRPVYYPFSNAVLNNGRKLINNALVYKDGKYTIDFLDFENKIICEKVKLFILCNPHNPVGRVWSTEELLRLGEICKKHNVIVVADEIHCDFVFGENKYTPFASVCKEFADFTVTCTAPSKTFNLAGLQASNIIISNEALRGKYKSELSGTGYELLNIFAVKACEVAYKYGAEWLDELLAYLAETYAQMRNYLKNNLEKARVVQLEGTYLVWVDFSAYGFSHKELVDIFINKAKVWLDDGEMFGEEGANFMRFNIACPRAEVLEALEKIKKALRS